jgi:hypothetical protein
MKKYYLYLPMFIAALLVFSGSTAMSAGLFDFSDGTTQGWTMDQLYINWNNPVKVTPAIGFTLLNVNNQLSAGTGALKTGSLDKNEFYLESPDLSSNPSWQGITGYSLDITRNLQSWCWGDAPNLFFVQLYLKVIDTADGNKEKLFAEYGTDFIFHDIMKTGHLYHFSWSPSWLTGTRYVVKKIRLRIMGQGDQAPECWLHGDWVIDNVAAIGGGTTPSASITVSSPNGGETWEANTQHAITWKGQDIDNYDVKIEYSTDGGTSYTFVAYQTNHGTSGSFLWTVPNIPSTNSLIRLTVKKTTDISDVSNAAFTISAATNTPSGEGVFVKLSEAILLLFNQVINPGTSTVTVARSGPNPPDGWAIIPGRNAMYYNITTTATYTGKINIDITYDDADLREHEPFLRIMRYELRSKTWTDITTRLYADINKISGETDHLSTFAVMYAPTPASHSAILVSNCSDNGPGSLREALNAANQHTGPDTILFAIPEGMPGHQPDAGIWVIQPRTELPPISDGQLLIDGFSQSAYIGRDSNPYGPEMVLDGSQAGLYANGFHVTAGNVTIVGLTIHHFDYVGIWMEHVDIGCIAGCYLGTDYRGSEALPNGWGICIGNRCRQVTVAPADTFRNVITGNLNGGILVSDSSQAIHIVGNIVGLDRTSTAAPGNGGFGGLCIQEHCDGVVVSDNRIGGNIYGLFINNSIHNTIQSNWIGISPESLNPKPGDLIPIIGNQNDGIYVVGESRDNLILGNIICQNNGPGIGIYGELPLRNRITQNCIAQNNGPAIFYESAGAHRVSAPIITRASSTLVSGTAIPDATIEIYTDAEDEGQMFQGQTQSGADGRFEWTGVIQGPLPNITAIAINAEGSTSPFSMQFTTSVEGTHTVSAPATLTLAQNYPNPFNPETTISYTLPAISGVRLTVYDVLGKEVAILVDEVKQPGVYHEIFNAVDCPSGLYFCILEAGRHIMTQKMMLLK